MSDYAASIQLWPCSLSHSSLAWFGWWDDIAKLIPYLSVHMNTGFYLVFSTGLLIIWLMMFFVFDRLTYWRPGQMTEEHLIGGAAESFDNQRLRFHGSDFFRAVGALVAVPVLASLKIICDRIGSLRPIAEFLSP